jgi:hypothetical protein
MYRGRSCRERSHEVSLDWGIPMNPQVASTSAAIRDYAAASLPISAPLPIQDVVLHHLRTPDEIDSIVYLRDEIDLSVHAAAGRQFELLEKKETSAVSSSDSNSVVSGSAPSALSRWAIN